MGVHPPSASNANSSRKFRKKFSYRQCLERPVGTSPAGRSRRWGRGKRPVLSATVQPLAKGMPPVIPISVRTWTENHYWQLFTDRPILHGLATGRYRVSLTRSAILEAIVWWPALPRLAMRSRLRTLAGGLSRTGGAILPRGRPVSPNITGPTATAWPQSPASACGPREDVHWNIRKGARSGTSP